MPKRITITIYDDTSFSSALYYAMKTQLICEQDNTEKMCCKFTNNKVCVLEKTKTNNLSVKIYK